MMYCTTGLFICIILLKNSINKRVHLQLQLKVVSIVQVIMPNGCKVKSDNGFDLGQLHLTLLPTALLCFWPSYIHTDIFEFGTETSL